MFHNEMIQQSHVDMPNTIYYSITMYYWYQASPHCQKFLHRQKKYRPHPDPNQSGTYIKTST